MIPGRKSSQVTLANDDNNTLSCSGLGSSRPIRGQYRGWTDQWEAWMCLEVFHCSQNPSLVVIIAGLTLSSLSGAWFLTNYPRCLVSAVLKLSRALCSVVSLMRTIRHRQQTPAASPLSGLWTPNIADNCSPIRQLRSHRTGEELHRPDFTKRSRRLWYGCSEIWVFENMKPRQ